MKPSTIMITLIALALFSLNQAIASDTANIILKIDGFANSDGIARIRLTDSKDNFNGSKPVKELEAQVKEGKVIVSIPVPYGEYAISVYHDENENNLLDKGMFDIPKEAYGFSNNARGTFGPPEYEAVKFMVNTPQTLMNITVK